MSNTEQICELRQVFKEINHIRILENLSFSLRQGKVTALLGPNGAGKTTTIRIILGLLAPTSGSVLVFGSNMNGSSDDIRTKIGLLPQSDSGYKGLTGRQNIEFILKLAGIAKTEYYPEFETLLKRLDLEGTIDKDWAVLSGGEQRAIGFIRAILLGKELLILDEPTSGLDLARAATIRKIIQEQVTTFGKTILMSSHIITDLEQLAEDIIIIKKGKILVQGERNEVISHFSSTGSFEEAIISAFSKS